MNCISNESYKGALSIHSTPGMTCVYLFGLDSDMELRSTQKCVYFRAGIL